MHYERNQTDGTTSLMGGYDFFKKVPGRIPAMQETLLHVIDPESAVFGAEDCDKIW
ncbi:MAG: hypothetical protein JW821_07870 [Deltaproteobacteria bacterium]|nr:hypothetical protein [Deltaproteobacteria bacterium]